MPSAYALGKYSGIILLISGVCRALRSAPNAFFTERVVKTRCSLSRSAALSQKAALQLLFAVTTLPVKMGFRNARRRF